MKPFDNLASSSSPLVGAVELEVQQQRNDDNQHTSPQRGINTRSIARLVLLAEYSRANNA